MVRTVWGSRQKEHKYAAIKNTGAEARPPEARRSRAGSRFHHKRDGISAGLRAGFCLGASAEGRQAGWLSLSEVRATVPAWVAAHPPCQAGPVPAAPPPRAFGVSQGRDGQPREPCQLATWRESHEPRDVPQLRKVTEWQFGQGPGLLPGLHSKLTPQQASPEFLSCSIPLSPFQTSAPLPRTWGPREVGGQEAEGAAAKAASWFILSLRSERSQRSGAVSPPPSQGPDVWQLSR